MASYKMPSGRIVPPKYLSTKFELLRLMLCHNYYSSFNLNFEADGMFMKSLRLFR